LNIEKIENLEYFLRQATSNELMYPSISISLPIKPISWQSVRYGTTKYGKMYSYLPKRIKDYKDSITLLAKQALNNNANIELPTDKKVKIDAVFVFHKKMNEDEIEYKNTKPDLTDNLMKPLADALNGVVWIDDSQIVDIKSSKINADCDNREGYILLKIRILN